ncbi:MAG: translocation/assembly module TamB domain-containing protein [Rhodanobacter sp.]
MNASTGTHPPRPRRLRWLRLAGGVVLLLVLLIGLLLAWLLGTGSGLRFALTRVSSLTDGALQVQDAQGRLVGPLDLRGVRYRGADGLDARITTLHLDLRFWPLLGKRLHVLDLNAQGVVVALAPAAKNPPPSQSSFSLKPPLSIVLDRAHVQNLKVTRDGKNVFIANRIDLAGRWTAAGLALRQLQLDAPDGHADLTGKLAVGKSTSGNGTARFAWKLGETTYAGALSTHSDGRQAQLQFNLSQPTAANLTLNVQQSGDFSWTGTLYVPRFNPQPIVGSDSSLSALGVALAGAGNRRSGSLNGTVDLNAYTLQLAPLKASFSDDFKTLTIEQLKLGAAKIAGELAASGVVHLGDTPPHADLKLTWQNVVLPADLVGQALTTQGSLEASGSSENFHAQGAVDIGPPGNLSRLALNLDGTPEQITVHTLDLKQATGGLQVAGALTLKPQLAWQLSARAKRFNPGPLLAGWNGALDFDLSSSGRVDARGPDATLDLKQLGGTLRQRKLGGSGKLHVNPGRVLDGALTLDSGNSRLSLNARPGASNDIDLNLAIASLGDWLPNAGGRLNGQFTIRGKPPALGVNGTLSGETLSYGQQQVQKLRLIVGIPDLGHPAGKVQLDASQVLVSGLAFQRVDVLAEGSQGDHQLSIDAKGKQLSGSLALHGALRNRIWRGTLSKLDLKPQGLPGWRLQKVVALSYQQGAIAMSELCLTAGDPLLCAKANLDGKGNLDASYRLQALPLELVLNAAGFTQPELPVRASGALQGEGRILRSAKGQLSGNAAITSTRGSVTYTDRPGEPLLAYTGLVVQAQVAPGREQVIVHAELDHGGHVDGNIVLSGAQQALSGQVQLHVGNLAFIELLTAEVANVKGQVNGQFNLGGTLQQPAVTGQAVAQDFAAEVPAAGLKLTQGQVTLSTADAKTFRLDGTVTSGKGTLTLAGTAGLGANARTQITLKGNQFTAAHIPAAQVVISPDLDIRKDAQGIQVGGSVTIDSANVNLDKLTDGDGAVEASPDVVVVDQRQQEQQHAQTPLTAHVTVKLGNQTQLKGEGLDGKLKGELVVNAVPGRAPTGQGQINVSGTYKAYGQDLTIQRGQLLFASTPLDNPGLNIRAVRSLNPNATINEGQDVGLDIAGTARRPILTVFSNPVMQQSDALSYLITGKPLSQVSSGQGSLVSSAAQTLGSLGGNLLAKSVGSRLGISDIGIASSDALGGNSAFTVGKYLSPRLYLSYGIGLFESGEVITLRYRLSQRWNLEAQQASEFSRASFNYRLEK